ncbi:antibiotic biosynthesis monooxygenase [Sphingomonas sanguinis]|uniref:putative quinol monooxygenase n=1 Tax=Sphingomonas sp. LC-1 TaxID=3110957 RepID=UPI0021BB22E1|nr:putative quinol monooxygenase [Sphingomonas sp. LC-1]MCT8002704.1 antibiotic biosynthesis monooxygenase [Sphingomonas sp. LC-1]
MTDPIVHVIARLVPRPDKAEELAGALLEMLDEVRAEPGCLLYDAHESRDTPGVIVMVEAWADQAALDAHGRAPALTRLAARFDALLAEPPAVERLRRLG